MTQLWFLLAVVVFCILYAGLTPLAERDRNDVYRLSQPNALVFPGNGVATYLPNDVIVDELGSGSGFVLELEFTPAALKTNAFYILLSFYGEDSDSQLVVGQWQHQLTVMNGDDYDYSERRPRAIADLRRVTGERYRLKVVSSKSRTQLYLNDVLVGSQNNEFTLPQNLSLINIGNDVRLKQPWKGVLYSASLMKEAVLEQTLLERTVLEGHKLNGGKLSEAGGQHLDGLNKPRQLVDFASPAFATPDTLDLAAPQLFTEASNTAQWRFAYWRDVILNLLGFIPLGIILTLLVTRYADLGLIRAAHIGTAQSIVIIALVSLISGFSLSFFIEYQQAWLMHRHSSWLDLVLNSAGSVVGAVILLFILYSNQRLLPRRSHDAL